jgi:peptidoglycan/xylan/chitin deacetylase (PgdA/CDA1 family)
VATDTVALYARWQKTAVGVDSNTRGLPVLMYHWFYDPALGERQNAAMPGNSMDINNFKTHLQYLHEQGYYFPSWDEVDAFVAGQIDLPAKSVVLTIDDGKADFYSEAVPALEQYKVRGTGFLITGKASSAKVKKYESKYVDLQSHTDSLHVRGRNSQGVFLSTPYATAKSDLEKSAELLGAKDALAYPFGHYNASAKTVVQNAGFKMAFAASGGRVYPGMDKYQLPRVRVNANTSLETLKTLVQ